MRHLLLCGATALAAVLFFACRDTAKAVDRGERLAGLSVGVVAPDFEILDKSGHTVRFSRIRGDVTILAFTAVKRPDWCKVAVPLHDLAMRESSQYTDVEYVGVSEPPDAKPDPDAKIKECAGIKLWHGVVLYDEGAKVKSLWGIEKAGVYFVIDNSHIIVGVGDVNDVNGAKKALEKAVRKANMDNSVWNQL